MVVFGVAHISECSLDRSALVILSEAQCVKPDIHGTPQVDPFQPPF